MFSLENRKNLILSGLTALFVGAVYFLPPFLVGQKLNSLGDTFVLLQLENHSDEVHGYLNRARQIYEGQFPAEPRIFPQLTSSIFATFLLLSGGNVTAAYLAANFVFAALIFLAFSLLGWVFLKDRLWALFIGLAGSLTPMATHLPYAFKSLENFLNIVAKNFYPLVNTPLVRLFHSRIDNPLLTLPFYLVAIAAIYLFLKNPNLKKAVFAGVSVGVLPYFYFHYWAYLLVGLGILFFYFLFSVKTNKTQFLNFLILVGVVVVLSLPYLLNYLSIKAEFFPDFFLRLWLEQGNNFRFSRIFEYGIYAFLAVLNYLFIFKKDRGKAVFFWVFLGAAFIVWNIQIVLGFQPELKWDKAVSPIIFLILAELIYIFSKKIPAKAAFFILFAAVSLLFLKKAVNTILFLNPRPEFLQEHSFSGSVKDSWLWMNKNLPRNSVVISLAYETSHYLAVYTGVNPYLKPGLTVSAPNFDVENWFLVANKLFNVPISVFKERIQNNNDIGDLYYNYYKDQSFDIDYKKNLEPDLALWKVPDEKVKELLSRYSKLNIYWKDIPADFVYYGPAEKKFSAIDLSKDKSLELVYKNPEVEIYKIIRK